MATTNALRPQVETTIGWAMPVRVEDFLPSLSAYDQALPTIAALRLCHRHGKGDACFLKRLPTELVDLIEVYVHVASRQSAYVEWEMQEQCAWGQCACDCPQCQHGRPEHQGRSSRGPEPAALKTNASSTARGMRKNSGILALTARKRGVAGATNGTHVCPHQTNLHDFALRTRDFRAVDADAKLVRKHFGLDVWTFVKHSYDVHPDDVRLRPLPMHLPAFDKSLRRDDDQHHRQILLMLPGSKACFEVRTDDRKRRDEAFWKAPCPEGKMMRRFVRACRLLGLRSGRDLSSLERFADMGDDEDNETNKDLQLFAPPLQIGGMGKERSIRQIPSLDIVSVSRLSSWESRMRSDWLQRGAL